jgi:hypothetical protein
MLQAERSPVRVPDEVNFFFNLPNSSSRTMALGSTQPLVPGIFLGVKSGRRLGLTTLPLSMSRMSENVGASTYRNPKGLHCLYRENFTLPILRLVRSPCWLFPLILWLSVRSIWYCNKFAQSIAKQRLDKHLASE